MTVEVIGVDHIFASVRDLGRSEEFYDRVMAILGFRKGEGTIGGDPHLFYYNHQFAYSLRPAREGAPRARPVRARAAPPLLPGGGRGRRGPRSEGAAGGERRATKPPITRSTPQTTTGRFSRTPMV
jgi:catechol 2,3-dioxygenase-like lactoylglutathione lyase family enzyme